MTTLATRMLGPLVQTIRTMAAQIIVSVATAICVAFITNAYVQKAAAPDRAKPAVAESAPAAQVQVAVRKQAREPLVAAEKPVRDESALPELEPVVVTDRPVAAVPAGQPAPTYPALPSAPGQSVYLIEGRVPEPERSRFLGVPIPRFVGAATNRVVSLVPGLGDRDEPR